MQSRLWGLGLHYAWIPVAGFLVGLALIFSLLGIWLGDGHPQYQAGEGTVVYVSDVGAANHALFIVLCTLTGILFFLSISADLWLRHTSRLPSHVRHKERIFTGISWVFAFLTMVFVILLSIFDAFQHPHIHWPTAVVFFICLVISGIANMVLIAELARSYPERRHLKYSFYVKLALIILGVCSIIAIAGLYGYADAETPVSGEESTYEDGPYSGVAALEWFILLIFDLYILSIVIDLYPTRRTSRHVPGAAGKSTLPEGRPPADVEMGNQPGVYASGDRLNGHHEASGPGYANGVNGHGQDQTSAYGYTQ